MNKVERGDMKNWFEVDKQGLKQLQKGKSKAFILRELIQNAWDEPITICRVDIKKEGRKVTISVEDDSVIGFRHIEHAYTLFADTYKRKESTKRGRFNIGEKLVFAICDFCMVETTKGTVIFDDNGRHRKNSKRKKGSKITISLAMNQVEYDELLAEIPIYFPSKGIQFGINGEHLPYQEPFKIFNTTLMTEIAGDDGILRKTKRKTSVFIHETDKAYLYEMGIPVCSIDCKYSIDIQQRVPLGTDRETVPTSFMRDLFSEVLNITYEDVKESGSSEQWIRQGMSDDRIDKEAVKAVVEKRYGEKVCVASPGDPNSIDDAISNGYRVIRGGELSKDEWESVRKVDAIQSSSQMFGSSFKAAKRIEPNEQQKLVAEYAKRIAKQLLHIDIMVDFIRDREIRFAAQYGHKLLIFNVDKLDKHFFEHTVTWQTTDLILHELGHNAGNHTEKGYHQLITKMAGQLVMIALEEPEFFKIKQETQI